MLGHRLGFVDRDLVVAVDVQIDLRVEFADPLSRLDDLKEIRRRDLCLMINCQTTEPARRLVDALGPEGLFLRLNRFDTTREAEDALGQLAAC